MSIASEITRIENAKKKMKSSIEKRGFSVGGSATLDKFSNLIDKFPYIIKGSFTPNEDTAVFAVNGLSFVPKLVFMDCLEFEGNVVAGAIEYVVLNKESYGMLRYRGDDLTRLITSISLNSSAIEWEDNGLVFTVSQTSASRVFKAGYTYNYIICGGYS